PARYLCGPHPQRRQARGPARGAVQQVRSGHQRRDRPNAWPRRAAVSARHRRRGDRVKRRAFITLLGGAAAWPLAARAQQPAMPVIGHLNPQSPDGQTGRLRGFRQGLKEVGFVEGQNVTIEYRWALGQYDRLPAMALELVRHPVTVLTTTGGEPSAFAAK